MSIVPLYLIKVLVSSGILFSYYWFFLRNKRFHQYNRFYLMFITLFSWIVPFIEIKIARATQLVTTTLPKMVYAVADSNSSFEQVVVEKSSFFTWNNFIVSSCMIISVVFLEKFLVSLWRIYNLIKKYPVKNILGLKVIFSEVDGTPFSFFDYIFWNTSIDLNSDNGKKILAHEVIHSNELHSLDKMIIELNLIIGWFNPFFWLIRNELFLIHEFIADSKSIENNDASELAALLLTVAYPQQHKLLLNPFFFSPIKRRIAMLTNKQKTKFSYLRRVAILPILGALVVLFAFKNAEKKSSLVVTKLDQKFTIVVDAGHGGSDAGALGVDGITEKELSLALSKRIAELNTNPNIEVKLTRTKDELINVVDRSNMINAMKADLLISLHMNSSNGNKSGGTEFFVSSRSANKEASTKLASLLDWSLKDVFEKSHGVASRNQGIWILDNSNCPAVIAEMGFISNKKDVQLFNDNKDKLANQILGAATIYLKYKGNIEIKENALATDKSLAKLASIDTVIHEVKVDASKNSNSVLSEIVEVSGNPKKKVIGVDLDTTAKAKANEELKKVLYILDGVRINQEEFKQVEVTNIERVNVLKGEHAREKYGEEGFSKGVVEIYTKTKGAKSISGASAVSNNNAHDAIVVTGNQPVSQKSAAISKSGDPVFSTAEKPAQFPGVATAWTEYLVKNLDVNVLKKNKAVPGMYRVNVRFNIDKEGKVSDVIAENNPGYGAASEAIRVIENGPNWIPAVQNGNKVNFLVRKTILFEVK